MQQVVLHGTGTNAQALERPAAGKTGTATNDTDEVSSSWFVGFTPQMATAVMYVRGDGDDALNDWLPPYNGAAGYFGAGYPTATWAAVMKRDLVGVPVEKFPPPANVPAKQTDHAPAPTSAAGHAHTSVRPRRPDDVERADASSRPPTAAELAVRAHRRARRPPGHCHRPPTSTLPDPSPPDAHVPGERAAGGHELATSPGGDRLVTGERDDRGPVVRPDRRRPASPPR